MITAQESLRGGRGSFPGQSMQNSWWTKCIRTCISQVLQFCYVSIIPKTPVNQLLN